MERNADGTFGATGSERAATDGASGFGASADALTSGSVADQSDATAGRMPQKFDKVKDKARELQSTLADQLDAGAKKLRQRSTATLAASTDGANVGLATDDRVAGVQDSVARGMNRSADWLRNGDLKADIENQVRENPGRTLLIALGVGYLLGRAFQNNKR